MNSHPWMSTTQPGRILHIAELNTNQIRQLNYDKTAVLLPGGILEQHGEPDPHCSVSRLARLFWLAAPG